MSSSEIENITNNESTTSFKSLNTEHCGKVEHYGSPKPNEDVTNEKATTGSLEEDSNFSTNIESSSDVLDNSHLSVEISRSVDGVDDDCISKSPDRDIVALEHSITEEGSSISETSLCMPDFSASQDSSFLEMANSESADPPQMESEPLELIPQETLNESFEKLPLSSQPGQTTDLRIGENNESFISSSAGQLESCITEQLPNKNISCHSSPTEKPLRDGCNIFPANIKIEPPDEVNNKHCSGVSESDFSDKQALENTSQENHSTTNPHNENPILDEQSSFSQSVTHTLSFTLRQTGMPAGPVSPNPEATKPSIIRDVPSSKIASMKEEPRPISEPSASCQMIAQEIKAEAVAMAACQIMQGNKSPISAQGLTQRSPKAEGPSFSTADLARRFSIESNNSSQNENPEPQSENPEPNKQNVLLKQLLQNCPSAETHPKTEDFADMTAIVEKCETLTPEAKEAEKAPEPIDESKMKKKSYLEIRRAQLEKEPTPPPEDPKMKRKRPKKKKDPKDCSPIKKRLKKGAGSKLDDGHEVFMENLIQQLRTLPAIRILEPHIKPNFNVCPVLGGTDLNAKECNLRGTYGRSNPSSQEDHYGTQPLGSDPPTPPTSLPPTPPPIRGFYNQEFATRPKELHSRIDVPLSLPTPPPYPDGPRPMRDTDSPDTIISSSSPECMSGDYSSKFMGLKLIDEEYPYFTNDRKSCSPIIPLIAPIPLKGIPANIYGFGMKDDYEDDFEKDKENSIFGQKADFLLLKNKLLGVGTSQGPLRDSANVSVTLTLTSSAAQDIRGVLSALAGLLKIAPPATYEVIERTTTPPSQKLGLYKEDKEEDVDIHSLLNGKPRFCRHCDIVVLNSGIRKKVSELPYLPKEEMEEDEVIFCSSNCYMQFALTNRALESTAEREAATVVSHTSDLSKQESPFLVKFEEDEETSDSVSKASSASLKYVEGKSEETKSPELSELSPPVSSEASVQASSNLEAQSIELTASGKSSDDKPASPMEGLPEEGESQSRRASKHSSPYDAGHENVGAKQWKGQKWKYWSFKIFPTKTKRERTPEILGDITNMCNYLLPESGLQDTRKCVLCHIIGDGETNGSGRLLNMDVDMWVHLNCALWSAEVYETVNGALINVDLACKRALSLSCCKCHKIGASLKCLKMRCTNIYHFPCAVTDKCSFLKDKTMLCSYHATKVPNPEEELETLAVLRRVYINRDEHKQIASMIQKGEQNLLRIGSLIFLNIGQLLPQQLQAFHTPSCIYPVGYKVIRMYWSMRVLGQRCQYLCSVNDSQGIPKFAITVKERLYEDVSFKDKSTKDVWLKVLEPIERMRHEAKTIKVFPNFITGDDLFGIPEPAILRILESLPGVDTLTDYHFKYGRSPLLELPLAINPTGCARSEPKLRTHFKRPHTLHTRNTSRFSMHSSIGGMEVSSPYTKQFVHSKSSQYRKMKTEWRNNVYLARSQIQGLGLYANRDIEKHTMVIEYIGQLIRNEIAERNELIYETQNRGVYMFRLDENRVIDATLSGGLARYMNHCCNPNCVAEVVQIDRENKILIIANRRINRGEELTYDYKFEVEDDQHKISCLCGAINCRKWMN